MDSVVAAMQTRNSGFQALDTELPQGGGAAVLLSRLSRLIRQAASRSARTWERLPRLTRIVLTGLLMTSCSFSLSMIVTILSH